LVWDVNYLWEFDKKLYLVRRYIRMRMKYKYFHRNYYFTVDHILSYSEVTLHGHMVTIERLAHADVSTEKHGVG
jgi:hypothetical protein